LAVEVDVVRSVEVPTRMVHGPGSRGSASCSAARAHEAAAVTDKGGAAGLVDRALEQLDGAVLRRRPAEPGPELVGEDRLSRAGCDGLVAIGGSSIDAAKAIGVEVVHGGPILQTSTAGRR
jgi:choline dehydrogenase